MAKDWTIKDWRILELGLNDRFEGKNMVYDTMILIETCLATCFESSVVNPLRSVLLNDSGI